MILNPLNGQIAFEEKALQLGINHKYTLGQAAGGISFVDFTGDGLDDLTMATPAGELIHFYINNGSGFYRSPPLISNNTEQKQILWADFDNDGDKDLFVCAKGDVNRLYQNKGNLIFEDITSSSLLPLHQLNTFNACWADFNRDGWLDLYVCERLPFGQINNRNYLFMNNADGTFTDISEDANVLAGGKLPFCSSALDYNHDKWPDIYIANDREWGNVMLKNEGDGTFSDQSVATNTDYEIDAMSVALGDYNNDSWTDIYVTNTPKGNLLLKNNGDIDDTITFSNEADTVGVSFNGNAWGANFIDADNDGDLDLYVSAADAGANKNSAAFFEQVTKDSFSIVTKGFEGDTVVSYANCIGDYNNDGKSDIAVMNFAESRAFLFENQSPDKTFIKVMLEGVLSNRDGIGSTIEIFSDTLYQYHFTHSGIGFQAQNSTIVTFGLGDFDLVDSLKITWPTGHIDKFLNIEPFSIICVTEGSTTNGTITIDEDIEIKEANFPSSTIEISNQSTFRMWPNPTSNQIQIQTPDPFTFINIFDANGKSVFKKRYGIPIFRETLDCNFLNNGVYYITITTPNGLSNGELIIHR